MIAQAALQLISERKAAAARAWCEQQFAAAEELQLQPITLLKMQQLAEGLGEP
jgi:hypothetical protein